MLRIVDLQLRQRQRLARQELLHLFEMILVDVIIAERVDKLAHFKLSDMRDQMSQKRIRTDVERDAEKRVGRALVELAMKNAPILHFELKQRMTRRQIDVISLSRIPARYDQSS